MYRECQKIVFISIGNLLIIFSPNFFLVFNMPRFYNRYWKRGWFRRGSVTRTQQSGRRYFNISFPIENIVALTVNANQAYSNVLRTVPWVSPIGTADTDANRALNCCGLVGSVAYRRYCQLYDQVKINSVSFSVAIADTIGQGGIPGLRIYTSWDRDFQSGEALMSADDLINGPEAQVVTFINNSRAKFARSNYASDLQERTTFIDSTNNYSANVTWMNAQWGSGTARGCGYSPSMSMVCQTSNTTTSNRTITVQIQARYNVTFRNPKFGLTAASNAKGFASGEEEKSIDSKMEEEISGEPVLKKKSVVYEEEVVPDEEKEEEDDEESQEPMTQSFRVPVKKAGKKVTS